MAKHLYNSLLDLLHDQEIGEEGLVRAFQALAWEFGVDHQIFDQKFRELLEDPIFWQSMDVDQRLAFLINAFFDALDETRVQIGAETIGMVNTFMGRPAPPFPKMLADFGFLFRCREYARVYSDRVCAGGFENTVKRASRLLVREYEEQFNKPEHAHNALEGRWKVPEAVVGDPAAQAIAQLDAPDRETRLHAIAELETLGDDHAVPFLERLLKDPDEVVMNRAFEAVLALKGMELELS